MHSQEHARRSCGKTPGAVSNYFKLEKSEYRPENVKCPRLVGGDLWTCKFDRSWHELHGIKQINDLKLIHAYKKTDKTKAKVPPYKGLYHCFFDEYMGNLDGRPYSTNNVALVSGAEFTPQLIAKMKRDSCGNLARNGATKGNEIMRKT